MRKFCMLLVMILPLITTSCFKEDDRPLDGTRWETKLDAGEQYFIEFGKTTFKATYRYDENGDGVSDKIDMAVGDYQYRDPDIVLQSAKYKQQGTVYETRMVLVNEEGDRFEFYKK